MTSPPSPVDLSSLAALVAPSPSSQVELVAILDAATSADTRRTLLNQVTQFCFVDPVQQTLRALSVPVPATSATNAAICLGSLGDQANFAIPISISSDAFDHLVVSILPAGIATQFHLPEATEDPAQLAGPPAPTPAGGSSGTRGRRQEAPSRQAPSLPRLRKRKFD